MNTADVLLTYRQHKCLVDMTVEAGFYLPWMLCFIISKKALSACAHECVF